MNKKDKAYEKESFYQNPEFPGVVFINFDAGGVPRSEDEDKDEEQPASPDTNATA